MARSKSTKCTPCDGVDQCPCGCKYWDSEDKGKTFLCSDCGDTFQPTLFPDEPSWWASASTSFNGTRAHMVVLDEMNDSHGGVNAHEHAAAIEAAERRVANALDHVEDTLAAYAAAEDAYSVALDTLAALRRNPL